MAKGISGDDLPAAYVDGWKAHQNNVPRPRNPYDIKSQFASYELWTEGWLARKYALANNSDIALDDFTPRVTL